VNDRFIEGRDDQVDFAALMVGLTVGLSIPTPAMVHAATAGRFTGPAAVLQIGGITIHGENHAQVLWTSDSLAALHGSLDAWRARLPVDVRDQYDATRAEAERRFTTAADKRLGKGRLL
jgi:hypothetical protein